MLRRSGNHMNFIPDSGRVPTGRLLVCAQSAVSTGVFTTGSFAPKALFRLASQRKVATARMGPFSLFVLSISAAVGVSISSLVLNSGLTNGPEVIASRSGFSLESWVSSLRGDSSSDRAKEAYNSQVQYVTHIISNKFKRQDAHEIARSIVTESQNAKIDPLFVASIIKSESGFKPFARSDQGAIGLMQLLPSTGEYISEKNNIGWGGSSKLTEPKYNIRLGVAYIKYLNEMFKGNVEHALIAYNWGPGNLLQALKERDSIPYSTISYARTIIGTHRKWKNDFSAQRAQLADKDLSALLG